MAHQRTRSLSVRGAPGRLSAVVLVMAVVAGASTGSGPVVRAADPSPPATSMVPGTTVVSAPPSAPAPAPFRMPTDAEIALGVLPTVANTPLTVDQLPSMELVRDQAHRDLDSMPEADWEIPALAEALDYDPERAFAFVRDSIGFDPYEGVLRGAAGTLAARAGNADDRALLLAALLDQMQVPFRFASADLDDASLDSVLAAAAQRPVQPVPDPGIALTPVFQAPVIQARASRDYAELRQALGDRVSTLSAGSIDAVRSATRHHVWVQRAFGTGWQDLDPTLAGTVPGATLVPAAETAASLPDAGRHRVSIRLDAETLVGDSLQSQTVLDQTIPASVAANEEIILAFRPAADSVGGTIRQVLTGDVLWIPTLSIDGDLHDGQPFRTGDTGTDVFGEPNVPAPPLTALRLTIEVDSPGAPPRSVVRALLDRVPADARTSVPVTPDQLAPLLEDDAGPLALGAIHHIMVSTGGADRRDLALQRYLSTDYAGSHLVDVHADDLPSTYGALWPVTTADRSLVIASEAGAVPSLTDATGARGYIAAPRVFIETFGRDPFDPRALAFQSDLAIDGVAVLPGTLGTGAGMTDGAGTSAADLQLWYGTLQTAFESQFALTRAALIDPGSRTISGISLGPDTSLRLVEPSRPASIPADAPAALRADLADGHLVLVRSDGSQPRAWWSVDPVDGTTRSMLDAGLGGARPSGPLSLLVIARTYDNSYSGGGHTGPKLPQRPPMQPQAQGAYGRRATCVAASEDSALACVRDIGIGGFLLLGAEVAFFGVIIWAIL
jgi:transglutaminase-like putative cysteine protease